MAGECVKACRRPGVAALAASFLLLAVGAAAAASSYDYLDGDAGQPWEVCAECHGMDGVSWSDRFPNIAAQNPAYLLTEMRHFRDGARTNDDHQMAAVLSDLSPDLMAKIAAWYAAQPPAAPAPPDLSPQQRAWADDMVHHGKGVLHGCDSCHDARTWHGVAMPRLDGERAGYLARQLRNFRDGARTDDPHGLMRRIAAQLTPEQIDVVARYLASRARLPSLAQR